MSLLVFVALFFIGVLEPAWGWHPGTHVFLGNRLLEMGLLSATLGNLVNRHRLSYLFGCVATDILFPDVGGGPPDTKPRSHPVLVHPPHDWNVARDLERRADTDPLRAFALGYRLHLAADTVAHEKMLPRISSTKNRLIRHVDHVLGESVVETGVPREDVRYLRRIVEGDFPDELSLLKEVLGAPESLWQGKQITFGYVLRGFTWSWSRALIDVFARLARPMGRAVESDREIHRSLQSMQRVANLNSERARPILAQNP